MKLGFDNGKYLKTQSEHIKDRISQFGGKLYLEFGGKLFDDYHASRTLPGFKPDSKIAMLMEFGSDAEAIIVIKADDIVRNKVRKDIGISYDQEIFRLADSFEDRGIAVNGLVITQFTGQPAAIQLENKAKSLGMRVYRHYPISGYPNDVEAIASEEGFGRNDYIETTKPLVVVTAPGPGSGKMAVCLSQLYHEHRRGIPAGYSKFETFPVWNLPLHHPVNLAYEAATIDLGDNNMIDPFHLEAYGVTTVNYNRDVEIFPVLNAILEGIYGESPYKSPTDMGVNMVGNCIIDDEACKEASQQEQGPVRLLFYRLREGEPSFPKGPQQGKLQCQCCQQQEEAPLSVVRAEHKQGKDRHQRPQQGYQSQQHLSGVGDLVKDGFDQREQIVQRPVKHQT